MSTNSNCDSILDSEFLPMRAKILELAASLDRIQRQDEIYEADTRWSQLHRAIEMLLDHQSDRAEFVQLLFSRPYDDNWRETMDLTR